MTVAETWSTRADYRDGLLEKLAAAFDEKATTIESGPLEGISVLSRDTLKTIAAEIGEEQLPPPSETRAEVRTPAVIVVSAICPRCGLPGAIVLTIGPELRVDASGAELRLQAKAKARAHLCGQMELPKGVDGQVTFALEDIVRPEDQLSDDERGDSPGPDPA